LEGEGDNPPALLEKLDNHQSIPDTEKDESVPMTIELEVFPADSLVSTLHSKEIPARIKT
jgi:hypothetical protein